MILTSNNDDLPEENDISSSGDEASEDSELYRSLYICKKIVEINHGQIDFYKNSEDDGTTFSITMHMEIEGTPTILYPEPNAVGKN